MGYTIALFYFLPCESILTRWEFREDLLALRLDWGGLLPTVRVWSSPTNPHSVYSSHSIALRTLFSNPQNYACLHPPLLGPRELGSYSFLIWVVVTQEMMYVRMYWTVYLRLVHFIQFVYMCFTSIGKKKKNPSLKFLDSFYRCPKLAQERPWPSLLDVYYGNTLKVGLSELSIICQYFSVF